MNQTVQGLWIGDELSVMERLSITSFLAHDHRFDLYVYGSVRGVPEGTRLLDANEVLPRETCVPLPRSSLVLGILELLSL